MSERQRVVLGSVGAAHGVRGWVRVNPFTEDRGSLLDYGEWQLACGSGWRAVRVLEGRAQGRMLVVRLEGVDTREQAAALGGTEVALWRDQLPPLPEGDYYWSDLIGLEVWTSNDQRLGVVDCVMETGANDVLVVKGDRERLVPYLVGQVVLAIDLEGGRMEVDWDPEF